MRFRTAAGLAALGLTLTACGSGSSAGPVAVTTSPSAAPTPTPCGNPADKGWMRLTDTSGVSFLFPGKATAATAKTDGQVSRTYLHAACGNTAVSVIVEPTALNTKNLFVKYPTHLLSLGNQHIRTGVVQPLTKQGFDGYRGEWWYDVPAPGATHLYELRAAFQVGKYFVILDTVATNDRKLTAKDLADAKAVNAALLLGLRLKP